MCATKTGKKRISFSSAKIQLEYPDFLEIQLKSFTDFFQMGTSPENRKNEGLFKVFNENYPISDTRNNFVLEFIDYFIDPPRYSIEECIERGLSYSVPLKAKLKLYCTDPEHEDFDTVITDVYLYDRARDIRNKWRGKSYCFPASPLSRSVLRAKHTCKRNQVVFCAYYSLQGLVDRICDRYQ
jgi:hypothetical protein